MANNSFKLTNSNLSFKNVKIQKKKTSVLSVYCHDIKDTTSHILYVDSIELLLKSYRL